MECKDSGVWSGECSGYEVGIVEFEVTSAKCGCKV
jgi:hypothetical protein